MSKIDKLIRLNLSMVKQDIGIAAGVCFGAVFCIIPFEQTFLGLIFIMISLGSIGKGYKKLYYTGLYGEEALIYRALPLKPEEVVASKVFVGFLMLLFWSLAAVMGIILGIVFLSAGNSFSVDFTNFFSGALGNFLRPEIMAPVILLSMAISGFYQASVIFAAVTWHNIKMRESKSVFTKAIAAFVIIGLTYLIQKSTGLLGEYLSPDMAVWTYALNFVLCIVIGALAFRFSVKVLKNDFCAE